MESNILVWNFFAALSYTTYSGSFTYAAGKAKCVAEGGRIAKILSSSENSLATMALSAAPADTYIGIEKQSSGVLKWHDGDAVPYT